MIHCLAWLNSLESGFGQTVFTFYTMYCNTLTVSTQSPLLLINCILPAGISIDSNGLFSNILEECFQNLLFCIEWTNGPNRCYLKSLLQIFCLFLTEIFISLMYLKCTYHEQYLNIDYINARYITSTRLHQYQFRITRLCRLLLATTASIQ